MTFLTSLAALVAVLAGLCFFAALYDGEG